MKDDNKFWMQDTDGQYTFSRKRKRGANKKLEFVGWGSRPLIEFIDSVGKDTSKLLTQNEVTTIVKEYINVNNLPLKKKRVLCDDRLYALFGKSVSRLKIYDALEKHFAENHDESEDEEDSSEEDDEALLSGKRKKTETSGKTPSQGKMNANQSSKSCFAAVVPENIKLVYLKKSLVLQLSKFPDDFEEKIKDSFVRIKSDRDDYLQKLPYHLEQVTGIKRISEVGNGGTEIQLLVTNSVIGVPLKMLSDDNFSEEECLDLRERIKTGLFERVTVVELSAKAKILHEDITKHWITREITVLQTRIDRANEKGWRKDLYEHRQRRQLLKTDAEQQRLLLQMPEVVAEELEQVDPPATRVDNSIGVEGNSSSPNSTLRGVPETSSLDASGMLDACNVQSVVETDELDTEDQPVLQEKENHINSSVTPVIVLSDDEDEPERGIHDDNQRRQTEPEVQNFNYGLEDAIWYYLDPQEQAQGPFTIRLLKQWSDLDYFASDFKVWRAGYTREKSVPLADVLNRRFPRRGHSSN
ncbi:hypothetical protein Leryth_017940 [Lithospermum erythrorhizon]|nr:hypothetical protein Leryth_017940 [Lithospermum erythrorhizon]